MRLIVLGNAISGTFLLTRLMSYFKESVVEDIVPKMYFQGVKINSFPEDEDGLLFWRKGNHSFPFNGVMSEKAAHNTCKSLVENNIVILNIVRDIFDAIVSKPVPHMCNLWVRAIEDHFNLHNYINHWLKYEDLVQDPDITQQTVADRLQLTIKHKWSSYPQYLAPQLKYNTKAHHTLRPINTKSVGKKERLGSKELKGICDKTYDKIIGLRKRLGYD